MPGSAFNVRDFDHHREIIFQTAFDGGTDAQCEGRLLAADPACFPNTRSVVRDRAHAIRLAPPLPGLGTALAAHYERQERGAAPQQGERELRQAGRREEDQGGWTWTESWCTWRGHASGSSTTWWQSGGHWSGW